MVSRIHDSESNAYTLAGKPSAVIIIRQMFCTRVCRWILRISNGRLTYCRTVLQCDILAQYIQFVRVRGRMCLIIRRIRSYYYLCYFMMLYPDSVVQEIFTNRSHHSLFEEDNVKKTKCICSEGHFGKPESLKFCTY